MKNESLLKKILITFCCAFVIFTGAICLMPEYKQNVYADGENGEQQSEENDGNNGLGGTPNTGVYFNTNTAIISGSVVLVTGVVLVILCAKKKKIAKQN